MQPDNPLRPTKHIFRVFLLLILFVVVLVLGRLAFVPKSWGKYGWYRGDNVAEQRDKPVMHGGDDSCKNCHAAQFETHHAGKHANVRCEVCHAPLAAHVKDNKKAAPMPFDRSRNLCLRCHQQLLARPASFPQVQPRQHVEQNGGDWGEQVCLQCHQPHSPL